MTRHSLGVSENKLDNNIRQKKGGSKTVIMPSLRTPSVSVPARIRATAGGQGPKSMMIIKRSVASTIIIIVMAIACLGGAALTGGSKNNSNDGLAIEPHSNKPTLTDQAAETAVGGEDLIARFAPQQLAQVIRRRVPLRISVSGKTLDLQFREVRPSVLEGQNQGLVVTIDYSYDTDYQALKWNITLHNESKEAIKNISILPLLLALTVDPNKDYPRVRHLSGSNHYDATYPPRAFRLDEERFMTHDHSKSVRIASAPGGSAYDHVPVLQFAIGPYGNMAGLFVGFEWSSRWYLEARWERNSFTGEPRPDFLIEGNVGLGTLQLDPGESLALPRIHMGFFQGPDWNSCDNALRRYVREKIAAKFEGKVPLPPVSYDHWFGIHQFFDVEDLKRQADRAAELGCEYFCVDAAWYPIKNSFIDGLGNWYSPDPKKFPHGIEELSEHVRKLGMGFGIWHLIEAGAEDSEVVQRHPNLYYGKSAAMGQDPNPQSPVQLRYLRLDLPEGRNLALGIIRKWIKDWHLTWMRWECSDPQSWTYMVDPSGKLNLIYMNGFYQVIDTIRTEFPDLYIEGVQGGGTRLDWGMAARTHGTWLSDHTANPDVSRFMQTGASRFWPAHLLNSAVRAHRNSGDSEVTPHNLLSRMVGTMSFNGDIAQWSPQATELAKKYVQVYKSIRPLLAKPALFLLPQPRGDRDWDLVLFGDEGGKRLLFVFRLEGPEDVYIKAPHGQWTQLLGSDKAKIEMRGDGILLHLDRNSSALWELKP